MRQRSDEKTFYGLKVNPFVAIPALVIVLLLVLTSVFVGQPIEQYFAKIQAVISNEAGWFFIILLNFTLLFALFIGFGKYNKVVIGGKGAKPDFSVTSWFAMLFIVQVWELVCYSGV